MLRAALALTLVLVLAGCAAAPADVERDAAGRATQAGTVRADKLRPGDCFDDQDDQTPDGFPVVPCARPHANEAFYRFIVPGSAYPGQAALTDAATARCRAEAFTDYVGLPIESSQLDVFFVLPSQQTWTQDADRTIICALFRKGPAPLTSTAKGSNQ